MFEFGGWEMPLNYKSSGHDKLIETVRGTGYRFKPDFNAADLAA